MAPVYPRSTLRKIVKAHSDRSLSKNADVLIYLDYLIFMNTLIREATIEARQNGEKGLSAKNIRKVQLDVCNKFRG